MRLVVQQRLSLSKLSWRLSAPPRCCSHLRPFGAAIFSRAPPEAGVLPHRVTLTRELHCIGRAQAICAVHKADRAAPHPPDTPPPGFNKPELRQQLENPKRVSAWGSFCLKRLRDAPPPRAASPLPGPQAGSPRRPVSTT